MDTHLRKSKFNGSNEITKELMFVTTTIPNNKSDVVFF